jgi:hypothetical protein
MCLFEKSTTKAQGIDAPYNKSGAANAASVLMLTNAKRPFTVDQHQQDNT